MRLVKFRLCVGNDNSARPETYKTLADVFKLSFGVEMPCGEYDKSISMYRRYATIVCRTDQFGEFIIRRAQAKLQNLVRELDANFYEKPNESFLDVS